MDLSGKVEGGGWTVTVFAHEKGDEFGCRISTSVAATNGAIRGEIAREFMHERTFSTPQEAMLEGLREGMLWVDLTTSNTICAS